MVWNHRILAEEYEGEVYFSIYEVYYKKSKPVSYTSHAVNVGGENIESIIWTLDKMKECTKKPILWAGDKFPQIYKK